MSYFHDPDFQEKMLMFVCRDRNFLKRTSGLLSARDFVPRKGEGPRLYEWVADRAYKYWKDYREPIGGLLRTEMQDFVSKNKKLVGSKQKEQLFTLIERIRRADGLVAVEAVEKKILDYRKHKEKSRAVKEMITLQEKGELSDESFLKICRKALDLHDTAIKVVDYRDDLEKRLKRRHDNKNRKFPYLFIDPVDREVRTFPRGELGIGLAKYKTGKSTLAVHFDQAYALQKFRVLHFTLEDKVEMVEDRLDASFTGVPMKSLEQKERKVRRRLKRIFEEIRGRIRIVDGTDGGMTVERMEEIWENFRNQGFAADVVVIDYDEGIEPPEHHKGDAGERREMQDIYKALKQFAAQRDLWIWVMAQTKRGKSGKPKLMVTGDDAAIDISKIKRCAMCLGLGDGPDGMGDNARFLSIAVHRYDKMRIGWPIIGDYERSIFYDREETEKAIKKYRAKKEEASV